MRSFILSLGIVATISAVALAQERPNQPRPPQPAPQPGAQPAPRPEPGQPAPRPEPGAQPNRPEPGRPEPGRPEPGRPEPGRPQQPQRPEPRRGEFQCDCNDNEIREAMARFMREHDANKDGFIQKGEFGGMGEDAERIFGELDKNHDDKLAKEELVPLIRRHVIAAKIDRLMEQEIRAIRGNLDRNRDGAIQRGEWNDGADAFRRADANNDGKIDGPELAWMARQRFEHRMGRLPEGCGPREPRREEPRREGNGNNGNNGNHGNGNNGDNGNHRDGGNNGNGQGNNGGDHRDNGGRPNGDIR